MKIICTANIGQDVKDKIQRLLDNGVSSAEIFNMVNPIINLCHSDH